MGLALPKNQWIWLMNTHDNLNALVTNPAMLYNNKATIDFAYNHKINNRSKYINIAYDLLHENVEPGPISLLKVESAENLVHIYTKQPSQVILQTFCSPIMNAK
jgi:hypothetical protein